MAPAPSPWWMAVGGAEFDLDRQCGVEVTIGIQQPDKVDTEAVKASFPHGIVTVETVKGGLDVIDRERRRLPLRPSQCVWS
jgi:hypothetical protein